MMSCDSNYKERPVTTSQESQRSATPSSWKRGSRLGVSITNLQHILVYLNIRICTILITGKGSTTSKKSIMVLATLTNRAKIMVVNNITKSESVVFEEEAVGSVKDESLAGQTRLLCRQVHVVTK